MRYSVLGLHPEDLEAGTFSPKVEAVLNNKDEAIGIARRLHDERATSFVINLENGNIVFWVHALAAETKRLREIATQEPPQKQGQMNKTELLEGGV